MTMATTPPASAFRLNSFSLSSHHPHLFFHSTTRPTPPTHLSFLPKASSESESDPPTSDDSFDSRLSEVRLRYRSGTGKKAEIRKMKKGKQTTGSGTGTGSGVFLPPVPLTEPVCEGMKVDFGFSPYSERVNGRLASVGLVGLLAVELATGKSMINYHTPAIVFIQLYFMAAVSGLYLKYQKEKLSVWPQSDAPPTNQ